MIKKRLIKYILLFLPFIIGSVCFGLGIYNLFSSLLFFCGLYIGLKNVFNYRKINNDMSRIEKIDDDIKNGYRSYDSVIGLKRTRRYSRVRKRIKY